MRVVHFVVPEAVDDPARPSGGNVYDRRLSSELTAAGWTVHEHLLGEPADVHGWLQGFPDGSVVLLDGLIAAVIPDAVDRHRERLRLVVLVHLPVDARCEQQVLTRVGAVITTSSWTRNRVVTRYGVRPETVSVARPGVDRASLVTGSSTGAALLCVGVLAPHKGQDLLLDALHRLADTPAHATLVGSPDRDPGFVATLRGRPGSGRVRFAGAAGREGVDRAYAAADLLVVPSRVEAFGMVVGEALARGLPVVAAEVGGLPEALGAVDGGRRPGLLVPPGDAGALADALRRWLTDPELRADLRAAAALHRTTLAGWSATAARVAAVLERVGR